MNEGGGKEEKDCEQCLLHKETHMPSGSYLFRWSFHALSKCTHSAFNLWQWLIRRHQKIKKNARKLISRTIERVVQIKLLRGNFEYRICIGFRRSLPPDQTWALKYNISADTISPCVPFMLLFINAILISNTATLSCSPENRYMLNLC